METLLFINITIVFVFTCAICIKVFNINFTVLTFLLTIISLFLVEGHCSNKASWFLFVISTMFLVSTGMIYLITHYLIFNSFLLRVLITQEASHFPLFSSFSCLQQIWTKWRQLLVEFYIFVKIDDCGLIQIHWRISLWRFC